ncbi:MAG: leucine-rich repeat protein, partial [Oscillospiraceae bacterium]|nr:leucine-rich repeat protein [Oscillospiraceae bacterium]
IGDHALSGCRNLTGVTIPGSVKTIGEYGISNCNSLRSIIIPDSVTTIGSNAFFCNQGLASVTIPDSVTTIGDYAFYLNESLESVTVPSSVTYLGNNVFIHCSGLEKAELSSNLTEIPSGLFCHCTSLKTVTMGGKLEHINTGVFEDCPNISNIIYSGTKAQWDEIVIERDGNAQLGKAAVITVPEVTISSNTAGKPKLSWEAIEGAAKYQIYRSTSGKTGSFTLKTTVTGTSYTNTDAKAGTTYYYKVRAVVEDGTKGEFSAVAARTCDLPQPVVTATNIASTGKIQLKWNAIEGAKEYKIYRSTSKTGTYKLLKTTTSTSLKNTSVNAGETYWYKVKAVHSNSSATSAYSTAVGRTVDLPQPVVTATNIASTGKIQLKWNAIEGAKEYKVYRSTTKDGEYKLLKTTTGTSLKNTSVNAGETYYYKVKAIHTNSSAASAYSTAVGRTVDLPQPVASVALNSKGKPKVTWNVVDGASKYVLYHSTTGENGSWTAVNIKGTSITHSSAVKGTKYYYKVKAVHTNSSANSALSTAKTITSR